MYNISNKDYIIDKLNFKYNTYYSINDNSKYNDEDYDNINTNNILDNDYTSYTPSTRFNKLQRYIYQCKTNNNQLLPSMYCYLYINTTGFQPFVEFIFEKYDDYLLFPTIDPKKNSVYLGNIVYKTNCISIHKLPDNFINVNKKYYSGNVYDIINNRHLYNINFSPLIYELFMTNPSLWKLYSINNEELDPPITVYQYYNSFEIAKKKSITGVSRFHPNEYYIFNNNKITNYLTKFSIFLNNCDYCINKKDIIIDDVNKNPDSYYINNNNEVIIAIKNYKQHIPHLFHYD